MVTKIKGHLRGSTWKPQKVEASENMYIYGINLNKLDK